MANHIWQVKEFGHETVESVPFVLKLILKKKLSFEVSCSLLGYIFERRRQHGSVDARKMIEGAMKSNMRFNRGKNAPGYLEAGKRLLRLLPLELMANAPAEVFWDTLMDDPEIVMKSKFVHGFTYDRDPPRIKNHASALPVLNLDNFYYH